MSQTKNEILMDKKDLSVIMEKIQKVKSEGPFYIRQIEDDVETPDEVVFQVEVPLTINGIYGFFSFKA